MQKCAVAKLPFFTFLSVKSHVRCEGRHFVILYASHTQSLLATLNLCMLFGMSFDVCKQSCSMLGIIDEPLNPVPRPNTTIIGLGMRQYISVNCKAMIVTAAGQSSCDRQNVWYGAPELHIINTCLELLLNCQCRFKFWGCGYTLNIHLRLRSNCI